MLAALALLLAAVQIEQLYPQTAPLHHLPTLALLLASPFLMRRWPLSTPALACILIFLALHTIGARWTYSNVPYDALARALTGGTISEAFGLSRNHYDRLVHLSYGLLAVLPMREVLTRHVGLSQKLGVYLAVESVLAVSALYEIFEWLLTLSMAGEIADRYNGQQGDMWDAQKDMAMAAIGALVAAAWQGRGEWRRR
jgi:putative membrane protein